MPRPLVFARHDDLLAHKRPDCAPTREQSESFPARAGRLRIDLATSTRSHGC